MRVRELLQGNIAHCVNLKITLMNEYVRHKSPWRRNISLRTGIIPFIGTEDHIVKVIANLTKDTSG